MAGTTRTAGRTGSPLDAIERLAWRIPWPTRRLLLALAVALVAVLAASGLVAGWVASRNAGTIDSARETGLGIASAATEFRTRLAAADAEAAATLISGGLEDPERRARYDTDLLTASRALTEAGLIGTADDAADISALADGLVRYAGLVETSRANSRQGFPVGAAYLNQARAMARDDLVPRAQRLRRVGEQRVARAANSVGGPVGALATTVLVLAALALVAASVVVAGRSRRLTHPALLGATVAAIAALVVVTAGIASQGRELRAAATSDIDAYVDANDAAFGLSNLRVTEIAAVAARGSGAPLFALFRADAASLLDALDDDPSDARLRGDVQRYVEAFATVEAADLAGDNRAAADITLTGNSATTFEAANASATDVVDQTGSALGARFDAASDADVAPLVPIVLGLVAAALAAAGILARARRYR